MPEDEPETLLHVKVRFSEVGRMLGGTSARPEVPLSLNGTSGPGVSARILFATQGNRAGEKKSRKIGSWRDVMAE
jgi:hypothetical protein